MTGWRAARVLVRLLSGVVLLASGAYFIIYLYRWEWNRAIISGIFFVAAEVAIVGDLLLGRLRRIEDSVARAAPAARGGTPPRAPSETGATLSERVTSANRAEPTAHFDWLRDSSRLGVFIPVLLGAGVILSAIAYVVERLAAAVGGPTADRRTVAALAPELPLGRGVGRDTTSRAASPHGAGAVIGWIVSGAIAVLLLVAAIDWIADATQSRPAATPATGATALELEIDQRGRSRPAVEITEALWVACRSALPERSELQRVDALDDDSTLLVVAPALGDLGRRRLYGCLQDATLDLVQAHVVASRRIS